MASTTFVSNVTKIVRAWLQDVNDCVYGPTAPTTTLRGQLADPTSASNGAGLVVANQELDYATNTVAYAAQAMSGIVTAYPYNANWMGVADTTGAFSDALSRHDVVQVPTGTYLANIDLTAMRGKTIVGTSRDRTNIRNFIDGPVFKLSNIGSDCKYICLRDLRILNRNKAIYTASDGIEIGGNPTNENDFHSFERVEIVSMRHGININNRSIWNSFKDVHAYDSILDGMHVETDQNASGYNLTTCRFGQNGAYGMQIQKASGDLYSGWTLNNCTWEKNQLNGIRVAGAASGIQGFVFVSPYFEENTLGIAAASASPRKANIWVGAQYFVGVVFQGQMPFGTPDPTPLDYGLYIEDACTNCHVDLGAGRWGNFAVSQWRLPTTAVFFVGPQLAGTGTPVAPTGAGGRSLTDLPVRTNGSFTGTLTGCTTSPTTTIQYTKIDNQVTLSIPGVNGASATTACTITGMPSSLYPNTVQSMFMRTTDGGVNAIALVQINTSGVIILYKDGIGTGFTAAGVKGAADATVTYLVT